MSIAVYVCEDVDRLCEEEEAVTETWQWQLGNGNETTPSNTYTPAPIGLTYVQCHICYHPPYISDGKCRTSIFELSRHRSLKKAGLLGYGVKK